MLNIFALSSLVLATLHMAVAPTSAHGYVNHPPSRQALCRDVPVPGCGNVKYEPQSVEAPKGSFKCNGNGTRFHELNEEHLWVNYFTSVHPGDALSPSRGRSLSGTPPPRGILHPNRHNTKLASFDDGGARPPHFTVVHQVPLHGYTGRQTILARWNIADTSTRSMPALT
ncbi:putative secreted chitin-binding protein [Mycena leptocephala]|nr:putative secreted chitin-binding protein [Mycena leptocephala]